MIWQLLLWVSVFGHAAVATKGFNVIFFGYPSKHERAWKWYAVLNTMLFWISFFGIYQNWRAR